MTLKLNVCLLILPLVLPMAYVVATSRDVARRLSDMTGYNAGERFFTVSASLAPYPFMIATVWTPFTSMKPALAAGLTLYAAGIALYLVTLRVFIATPFDQPFFTGPYRISRNPLYVAATLAFLGICIATTSLLLFGWLIIICILQHFMILAEERICREKYGTNFDRYLNEVPRYLWKSSGSS